MKNLIFGVVGAVILAGFIFCIMTIGGNMTRTTDLTESLSSAVDGAVSTAMEDRVYTIEDQDEFVSDFLMTLLNSVDNDSEIHVDVLGADYDKGLLSVKVTETYKNPNGKKQDVSVKKTVVMEQLPEKKYYTVVFLNSDNSVYKRYNIKDGCGLPAPDFPADSSFKGWKNADGNEVYTPDDLTQMKADRNYTFYPVYQ